MNMRATSAMWTAVCEWARLIEIVGVARCTRACNIRGSSQGKQSYEYFRNFSITFNVQNKVLTTLPVPEQFNQLTTVTYTQRGRWRIMTNGWAGNLRQRWHQAGGAEAEAGAVAG